MPTYTSGSDEIKSAESGHKVTDDFGDQNGARLVFGSTANWICIKGAGNSDTALSTDAGIYTTGQFQCMAIIVADFTSNIWSGAKLLHVSSDKSAKIAAMFEQAGANAYAAIGGRFGSLKMMENIRNIYAPKVKNFWIYTSPTSISTNFGMNKEGYFGETG